MWVPQKNSVWICFNYLISVSNGILVIKHTLRVPRLESNCNFWPFCFFGHWVWWVWDFFFFFFFHTRWSSSSSSSFFLFLFTLGLVWSSSSFFFLRFDEFGYWELKEKRKKKKVKAARSYKYVAHKKLKILSDVNWKQCPNGWDWKNWGILSGE